MITDYIKLLIGKPKQDVVLFCETTGYTHRVVREDDASFAITDDLNPDRLNLTIHDGIVTKITMG